MRVLSSVLDPRFGGPPQRSLSVARELRAFGVETVFLIPDGDDGFADAATDEGFDVLRIRQPRIRSPENVGENLRFLLGFRSCSRRIETLLEEHGIDLAHVNGPLNYPVALAAKRSDAALVWHFNDTLTPSPLKQLSSFAARRWADSIVVAADAVHEYFFPKTVESETIYAPVDPDEFDPAEYTQAREERRNEFGIGPDTLVIGAVGNLNPAKGYMYLLDAITSVHEQHEDIAVLVVGAELDSQQEYFGKLRHRVASNGLADVVTFTGWRSDVPEMLAAFDVFVLPSVTEACPIVVLEAMAMRRAVVATDVGGVREQIPSDDYGWVVAPQDAEELARGIDSAIALPDERRQRGWRARNHIEDVFTLERCVEQHVQVYKKALDRI